jgi:hypothetical protein
MTEFGVGRLDFKFSDVTRGCELKIFRRQANATAAESVLFQR